jgi:L-amino acid N-acyltransferase YncA
MNHLIRPARKADATEILKIYTPYINNTAITFETEIPTIEEFTKRIETIQKHYPYLVCERDNQIIGYAYASQYRERSAYRYSIELSIYVDQKYRHQGIGTALYTHLFDTLQTYEFYTAYACITLPNESSIVLHQTFGFQEIGIFHHAGYKGGKWLDVIWMEKQLKKYDTPKQDK